MDVQGRLGQAEFEKPGDGPGEDGKDAAEDRSVAGWGQKPGSPWARADPHIPSGGRKTPQHGGPRSPGQTTEMGRQRQPLRVRDRPGCREQRELPDPGDEHADQEPTRKRGLGGHNLYTAGSRIQTRRSRGCPRLFSHGPCWTEPPKCLTSAERRPLPT